MTEDAAQDWLREHGVSRETMARLDSLRQMVIAENAHQNLIGAASIPHFWVRHIVDSAQLLDHADQGPWLDLGTGAGFPGLVIAILRDFPVTLVESRRKRVDFLGRCVDALGLGHVRIAANRVETLEPRQYATISARAFAPLPQLFTLAHKFSDDSTIWVLPKGRSARQELETARRTWQGRFHVKQSVTDDEAAIIVASGVRRIGRKKA